MPLLPLFSPVGGLGSPELIIILLIAVLLFGANKIPKLARSTGQAIGEFRRGREEIEEELQGVREDVEETAAVDSDVSSESAGSTSSESASTDTASTDTASETETESADEKNQ